MKRKLKPSRCEPQPFNERAHGVVGDIIEAAELALIRNGKCQPHETDAYLTIEYIKECGTFLEHGQAYHENEGRLAAGIFLWHLSQAANPALKARYHRNGIACDLQLHWHVHYYFPSYLETLRMVSLRLLHNLSNVDAIDQNGVLRLAMANLPNVLRDIRRERRRRGAGWDKLLIEDSVIHRRIAYVNRVSIELMSNSNETKHLISSICRKYLINT